MRLLAVLACLAVVSCSDTASFEEEVQGTYVLTFVNGQLMPVRAHCSADNMVSGRLTLGSRSRTAEFELEQRNPTTGAVLSYRAVGIYNVEDNVVGVTVNGRWSHQQESFTNRIGFDMLYSIDGPIEGQRPVALARRGVGAECDASNTEIYVRHEPLQ